MHYTIIIMERKRKSKYYQPHTDKEDRKCDYPNCNKKGLYKAPKDRNLKEYYWFCLEHVTEYNANWDYYKEMSEEEIEEDIRQYTVYRESSNNSSEFKDRFNKKSYFTGTNLETEKSNTNKALEILEIKFPFTKTELKKRYKDLAKKYHPDTNNGDKNLEEKFKNIAWAYDYLLTLIT